MRECDDVVVVGCEKWNFIGVNVVSMSVLYTETLSLASQAEERESDEKPNHRTNL